MSEHHRGAWDTRGDAVWWPGTMSSADQQLHHHQQLLTQHHQQQLAAQQLAAHQQSQQSQLQQHNDSSGRNVNISTTSTAASQQLFSYKMASSFPNPATTMSGVTVSSTGNPVGAYDYRLGMISRPGDPPSMASASPAATQWWYAGQANIDNAIHQQQQQQQNQHQSQSQQNNQQNVHNAHTPPSSVCTCGVFFCIYFSVQF